MSTTHPSRNYRTDINYRKEILTKLLSVIQRHEESVITALHDDFKKPAFEAVVTETAYVISDLKHTIKNLKKWTRPEKVWPSILNFPSSDFIYKEPYGKVLVISPWNYPFQLAMCPLISAVAAGNQVVVKPSELTPNTASVIGIIIAETFDPYDVEVYQGGVEVATKMLEKKWDYIFFTGSVAVGKIIAKAAAEKLTPVTLELGGKNPCIVDETANLPLAAKRIVWGKFLNAGQTCIAPDHILIPHNIKDRFIGHLKDELFNAYGDDPQRSPDFARIVNDKNWQRLSNMIDPTKVAYGGQTDQDERYIAPTIIDEPAQESMLMAEEIFGPILPIVSYRNEEDLYTKISRHNRPLAMYVFTEKKSFGEKIISQFSFGGGCINDTIVQFSNNRLPFGGVGDSGIGAYHGKLGFDTFSHRKSVVKRATWLDITLRYAPYAGKLKKIRNLMKWI
ncbi:MAG TPA: aldehyde dehydrogenase [Flavobacterium sp.]|jgi:aldehyde dehydrogenase (NAD+)